ncbi:PTS system glucoside-specific EIICBA component [compost metagenome]
MTGDISRYFAGDPRAGQFLAGMFPMMIFGLPAACLAMYRHALPARRKLIGGILLSMALTSALTGVTEPVEFAFMFLAPMLYLIHAVLTGLAMALCDLLNIRLGFTFSGGAIDMALGWGRSTNGWMVFPVGLLYALVYYFVFDFCIRRFDLKTPGREDQPSEEAPAPDSSAPRGKRYIDALGGGANLLSVDACTTRLRLLLKDRSLAQDAVLKTLGAMAVVRPGSGGSLQVVVGPLADTIADEIRNQLPHALANTAEQPQAKIEATETMAADDWLSALGGKDNLLKVECVALTRVRIEFKDARKVARERLLALGCQGVSPLADGTWHLLLGKRAAALSQALQG